jgi:hypothetical protein
MGHPQQLRFSTGYLFSFKKNWKRIYEIVIDPWESKLLGVAFVSPNVSYDGDKTTSQKCEGDKITSRKCEGEIGGKIFHLATQLVRHLSTTLRLWGYKVAAPCFGRLCGSIGSLFPLAGPWGWWSRSWPWSGWPTPRRPGESSWGSIRKSEI